VDLKYLAMGWLLCAGMIVVALFYVVAEKTPVSEEHHNGNEDVDHTVTFRNRRVSMCKMRELEPEQMN
jgi:hypothetical protein